MYHVFSFFEGKQHLTHFATEQDVADEFIALLSEARDFYLQDVIVNGKRYSRYVDDFINSHRYINCDNAVCKNCHEMNIHIVKGLLTDCAGLVKKFFTADTFTFEDCMRLKWKYDFYESSPGNPGADNPTRIPTLSFGCNFSREQMKGIVACATAFHLFCVSTLCVEDMEALFSCREDFSIRVNNVRTWLSCSMLCSKTGSSNRIGSPFLTKDGSLCQRTAGRMSPLQACLQPCLSQG